MSLYGFSKNALYKRNDRPKHLKKGGQIKKNNKAIKGVDFYLILGGVDFYFILGWVDFLEFVPSLPTHISDEL